MGYNCESCSIYVNYKYGSGRFCSISCASKRERTKEIRDKISKSLKEKRYANICRDKKYCIYCNIEIDFENKRYRKNQLYCSRKCTSIHKNIIIPDLAIKAGRKSASVRVKRSKNEIYFSELCEKEYDILTNYQMFDGWDADVIIPTHKIAILWNGKWHYEQITKSHSLEQVQNRDRIKIKINKKTWLCSIHS